MLFLKANMSNVFQFSIQPVSWHFIYSSLKKPEKFNSEKAAKKSKVLIFLSMSGIDILEYKTKVCERSILIGHSNDSTAMAQSLVVIFFFFFG